MRFGFDVVDAEIEVDASLADLRLRYALQDDRRVFARTCEQHVIGIEQANLVIAERLGPELGEYFGVGAVDDDVDVRISHQDSKVAGDARLTVLLRPP